jgi:transposase
MNFDDFPITEKISPKVPLPPFSLANLFGIDFLPVLVPSDNCSQCSIQRENNELRSEVGYWKAMHRKSKEQKEGVQQENEELKAKLKLREQQLFGKKSEQGKNGTESQDQTPQERRKRGQQRGASGHGRRRHETLPVIEEMVDLPEQEQSCPCCGLPFDPFPGTEDSDVVEVEVKAHVRQIRRKRYIRVCSCENLPVVITTPGPAKLIPKGAYGDSVWIEVLMDKFLFYRPTSRLLESFHWLGLDISQGTITDVLKRLAPLFEPVCEQIVLKSRQENHWHADETRWLVFAEVEGKIGYRWYLWVFKSASTVLYILDQSRSSKVPKAHLKEISPDSILSVDRYSAYKALAKEKDGSLRLAWCWAHVRRDFFDLAKAWPDQEEWGMAWIEQIGALYHLNHCRLEVIDKPVQFAQADELLRNRAETLKTQCDDQLNDKKLHPACCKVLESFRKHWPGLKIFLDHPEIPMDNNAAERALRGPVVGRKNFYGSGALWSGLFAALMFTLFQTLILWDINPRIWLERFFRTCAENGGKPLKDVSSFLPWNMNEQELETLKGPPKPPDDTS